MYSPLHTLDIKPTRCNQAESLRATALGNAQGLELSPTPSLFIGRVATNKEQLIRFNNRIE